MSTIEREAIRRAVGGPRATGLLKRRGTTTAAPTTTTVTDSAIYSSAISHPIRQGDILIITDVNSSGGDDTLRGQRRYVFGPPSTTGVITVSPAFSGTPDADTSRTYEVWSGDGPHPDQIDELIDQALEEDCWYWRLSPLCQWYGCDIESLAVSAGNLVDALATGTTLWTATSATPSLPNLDPSDRLGRRAIRVTATATPGYLESAGIDVDPDNGAEWRIFCLVRALATATGNAGGAASIVLRDLTNSATITPSTTLAWTRRGWGILESSFTVPATCNKIALRLQADTNTQVADFIPQVWQTRQRLFALPPRLATKEHVGKLMQLTGSLYSDLDPDRWDGNYERRDLMGRGVQLWLDPAASSDRLWYYEKASYPSLTSDPAVAGDDDAATWCPEPYIVAATQYEMYRYLAQRDSQTRPGYWAKDEENALLLLNAMKRTYGAEPMKVEDSTQHVGPAIGRM
jgi:hypothetical protein